MQYCWKRWWSNSNRITGECGDWGDTHSENPTTASQRSCATTHTASESSIRRRSDDGEGSQLRHAEGLFLKKERERALTTQQCSNLDAVWCRLTDGDARHPSKGERNRYGNIEWVRLCPTHSEAYDEGRMTQERTIRGCLNNRSGAVVNGAMSRVCIHHLETPSRAREEEKLKQSGYQTSRNTDEWSEPQDHSGASALGRVAKLQKRVNRRARTPLAKKQQESEGEGMETRSNSCESGVSRKSPMREENSGTYLSPNPPARGGNHRDGGVPTVRRKSTGNMNANDTTDMMPFELMKRPIRPLTAPLASQHMDFTVSASTENELIVNKLEASDEMEDPERQWAKIAKYDAYASRGFGTFTHAIGLGVYGMELRKTIRRQANNLKHTMWGLGIKAPITSHIATGMALVTWGAEGGKNGSIDSILLGDCFPTNTRSCEQFRLCGEKIEDHGEQPSSVNMFVKMTRRRSRLYAEVYGPEHLTDRLGEIDRLNEIREECPEFVTVSPLSEIWERVVSQNCVFFAEGVHFILGRYGEGATLEHIIRYALSPDGDGGKAWKFTPIFDFDDENGFWKKRDSPGNQTGATETRHLDPRRSAG